MKGSVWRIQLLNGRTCSLGFVLCKYIAIIMLNIRAQSEIHSARVRFWHKTSSFSFCCSCVVSTASASSYALNLNIKCFLSIIK